MQIPYTGRYRALCYPGVGLLLILIYLSIYKWAGWRLCKKQRLTEESLGREQNVHV